MSELTTVGSVVVSNVGTCSQSKALNHPTLEFVVHPKLIMSPVELVLNTFARILIVYTRFSPFRILPSIQRLAIDFQLDTVLKRNYNSFPFSIEIILYHVHEFKKVNILVYTII